MTGGAASLAMAAPTPTPPARTAARSEGATNPANEAAAGAPAHADGRTAVDHAATERVARPGEHGEDATSAPTQSFAQLLAQAPPVPPPAPPPPAPATDAGDTATATDATSPGHLLALLDGAWSGTRAAANASTAAVSVQGAGLPASTTTAAAQPTLAGAPAQASINPNLPLQGASSAPSQADVEGAALSSTLAASPALEAAATARDASAAAQTGISIEAPAAGLAGSAPLAAARPPVAAPALPPLPMPADPDAGFDEGFGTRLVWMAEQRVGHAEIRLNPEHVGPINVRVQLDGEQVRAEFHSTHAEVRQAIEASLPRLRELLGQHGLQLGQADVGQGQAGRDGGDTRPGAMSHRGDGTQADDGGRATTPASVVHARGLLDEYA